MAEQIGRSGFRRVGLEELCAKLGREVGAELPLGIGFAFLLFDFGGDGNIAYVANAKRQDMVEALRELVDNLDAEIQ